MQKREQRSLVQVIIARSLPIQGSQRSISNQHFPGKGGGQMEGPGPCGLGVAQTLPEAADPRGASRAQVKGQTWEGSTC